QVGVGPGDAVGVQARGAVRGVVGAGPLDAAAVAEFLVAEPGVVAGASGAAPLPGGEGGLGVVPADQGGAVLVAEVHAGREVEQDVEVGPRLAGRFDRLVGQVHGAVGVGEGAGLLAPGGGGQHDVGELGGLGEGQVLHRPEQPGLGEDRAVAGRG